MREVADEVEGRLGVGNNSNDKDPVLFIPPIEVPSGSAPSVTPTPVSVTPVDGLTSSPVPTVGTGEEEEIGWVEGGMADKVARRSTFSKCKRLLAFA